MKYLQVICIILGLLTVGQCLYEDSKYVKTLKWANFKKDVMESKEPWFLNFGTNNDPGCKKFVTIWEQAAEQQHPQINYGWVDLDTQKSIANFFGLSGTNHQIFLAEDKPKPAGAPAFFSWPKDLKNVTSFSKNELFVKKRQHIFRGTEFTKKLVTKKDLDTKVLASKDPWFLLFCSEQEQQDCLEIIYQFDLAAQQLKGKVKFGLVDTHRSEITGVFGINGTGVCIYLGAEKPGAVGSPSLVGSSLKKKDYEKHVWDILDSTPTESAKQIVAQYPQIPEVSYQQIMKHDGAYVVLFYSGSELFGNDEQLKLQLEAFSQVKLSEKFKIGKMSIDNNRWIVAHLDIWPVPSLQYFPVNTKTAETIILYEGDFETQKIQEWAEEELFDNLNDKQIILTRQNFETQVMGSQDPWFVQFYTLNNNWCRKCAHLQPEWKKLSNLMDGQVNVAKLNCDIAKDICQSFQVFNFPKLLFFPKGNKSWTAENNVDYEGAFSKNEMFKFATDQANIGDLSTPSYLDSPETYAKYCTNFNGICFITLLPKESGAQREQYIQQIKSVSEGLQKEPVSFMWSFDGDQPELQERFELCTKGAPCTVGLDHRTDKELGFKTFTRKFSDNELKKNVNDLLTERRGFIPIKKALPPIVVPGTKSTHTDL